MSSTEQLRTFLAITPDDAVLDVVQEKMTDLRRAINAPGVRWETRSKWHVTLQFLGDVRSSELPELYAAVEEACRGREAFTATVEGVGGFPSLKRPRILWAGIQAPDERLPNLYQALLEATARFTVRADEKRFHPHLTLARIRTEDRRVLSLVDPAVRPFANTEFGTWRVRYVEVWRSILQPGGSQYELLTRTALQT